jgi:hypothetical protein
MYLDFVEVGTCDFDTLIEKADDNTYGLSIEGIKMFLEKLPDKPNVKKINCLVSDCEGTDVIYSIRPELFPKLPEWVRGSNSISKPHPIVMRWLNQNKLPTDIFVKHIVNKKTLYNILKENNITGINYLKIDAEGHDEVILKSFLKDINIHSRQELLPYKIQFERNGELHTKQSIETMIEILVTYDYIVDELIDEDVNHDVVMIKNSKDKIP